MFATVPFTKISLRFLAINYSVSRIKYSFKSFVDVMVLECNQVKKSMVGASDENIRHLFLYTCSTRLQYLYFLCEILTYLLSWELENQEIVILYHSQMNGILTPSISHFSIWPITEMVFYYRNATPITSYKKNPLSTCFSLFTDASFYNQCLMKSQNIW